jgi:hypothetical protein
MSSMTIKDGDMRAQGVLSSLNLLRLAILRLTIPGPEGEGMPKPGFGGPTL